MSAYARDPILTPVSIMDLRPTQISVGIHEVNAKRKHLRKRDPKKIGNFLGDHMIPVILGPKKRPYVIDHHHLALSLHEEGIKKVLVTIVADLSELEPDDFWLVLDHHSWVHPYDENGRRRDFSKIPKSIAKLKDDPFRSLAGELRRVGGFAKDTTPFSEFLWADFFRRRMGRKAVKKDFPAAIKKAMKLAKSIDARYLPGWSGPVDS
ncbi:MAG TPA: ParB-like protein [Pseudolabrys sp.]|nr:ParB-like protein [Pseudolabrys sp.]